MNSLKGLLLVTALSLTFACSHPIEIIGDGDVHSATGNRTCTLELFEAKSESCTKNNVTGAYKETYFAVARSGWKFEAWRNYCQDATVNECSFDVPADLVNQNWGATMPPLVAEFSECAVGFFPSFVYDVPTYMTLAGFYLSDENGCRRERAPFTVQGGVRSWSMHRSADGSVGVLVWSEGHDSENHRIRKIGFTVTGGVLKWDEEGATVVQTEPDGFVVQPQDTLSYYELDAWGNTDHSGLYLALGRVLVTPLGTQTELRIYNLNPAVSAVEYRTVKGWSCPTGLNYPEFVATCYSSDRWRRVYWNPSGTNLYITAQLDDSGGKEWTALLRLKIDKGQNNSRKLLDWELSLPQVVYTDSSGKSRTTISGFRTAGFRPVGGEDLLNVFFEDLSGSVPVNPRGEVSAVLNADQCADEVYSKLDGTRDASSDLWLQCIDPRFVIDSKSDPKSWQSPDSMIIQRLENREYTAMYRLYVTGVNTGKLMPLIAGTPGVDNGR